MDSSPTHRRPTISAPDTVPSLTTRTHGRGVGRVPVRPDADAVLVFPAREGAPWATRRGPAVVITS